MKRILFFALLCISIQTTKAQTGIGTNTPNAQAILDVKSDNKGVLLPRISLTNSSTFIDGTATNDHNGMMVYNTNTTTSGTGLNGTGFYHWSGGASGNWYRVGSIPATTTNSTQRWNGSAWVENTLLQSNGATQTTVNSNLVVTGTSSVTGQSAMFDTDNFRIITTPIGVTSITDLPILGNYETFNISNYTNINSNNIFGNDPSQFFNQITSDTNAHHTQRISSAADWGFSYEFNSAYLITDVRLFGRPTVEGRSTGGVFQLYLNGNLVATSPTIVNTSGSDWSDPYLFNLVADEVRYIYPNGKNNDDGGNLFNPGEIEINARVTTFGLQSRRDVFIVNGNSGPTFTLNGSVRMTNFGTGTLSTDSVGNISVSSDERLKIIGDDFDKGLEAILALKPIDYHWNKLSGMDQNDLYSGFSAQNVQSVIPEAVGIDSRGYLTLSERPILAAAVNAIKELHTQNMSLEAELEALKISYKAFLLRLSELENASD